MNTKIFSRAQAEDELVHALTRQIGYTAGGFSVLRMAGIVELFEHSSAYQFELLKKLQALKTVDANGKPLSEKYAVDLLSFAGELGIISKVPGDSIGHLSRYIVTDAGVALRAASKVEPELGKLVLEHLILENDADAYLTSLGVLATDSLGKVEDAAARFRKMIVEMRNARSTWLHEAFPTKAVLLRVLKSGARQVHWLKVDRLGRVKVDEPGVDFGRHHLAPRKSWAIELDHYDPDSKALTSRGKDLMLRAAWSEVNPERNWILPPRECIAFLKVSESSALAGKTSPTFELLRPQGEIDNVQPTKETLESATEFLRTSFQHIKLVHARQAPTAALKYFLLARERELKVRIDFETVVRDIAKDKKDEFAFFSSRAGTLAYYQLKKRANG